MSSQRKRNAMTKEKLPNLITALRIAGTAGLIFAQPLTPLYFVIYTLCGLSDVLDGWLARHTGSASDFGARLDSLADLFFYTVMIVGLMPVLWALLPPAFWWMLGGVLLIRLGAYTAAALRYRRFAALHTYMNKLTGAVVFLLPYMLKLPVAPVWCWGTCAVAALASTEELLIHVRSGDYDANRKTIFRIKK